MLAPSERDGRVEDAIIFVDVDGVLNIGVGDPGNRSLDMTAHNMRVAVKGWEHRETLSGSNRCCLERLLAAASREVGHGERLRYGDLTSSPDSGLCDLLVGRLCQLLQAAGPNRLVVLSSSWRCPRYAAKVHKLESAISAHLGSPFRFDARTPMDELGRDSGDPVGRIKHIGQFLKSHCANRCSTEQPLRVLVLDDFNVTRLQGLVCNEVDISGPSDVEQYLRGEIPAELSAKVKVEHTFEEWSEEGGLHVTVGCGLVHRHFESALGFLQGAEGCEFPPELPCVERTQAKEVQAPLIVEDTTPPERTLKEQVISVRWGEAPAVCWLMQIFRHIHTCTVGATLASKAWKTSSSRLGGKDEEDTDKLIQQAAAKFRSLAGA